MNIRFSQVLFCCVILFLQPFCFCQDLANKKIITANYELYVPISISDEQLAKSISEINYAVNQFEKYFQESPRLIAVVLVDSTEELKQYDFSSFVKRDIQFFAWLTSNLSWEKSISNTDNPVNNNTAITTSTTVAKSSEIEILSHEAAHKYFHDYVDKKLRGKTDKEKIIISSYGHPSIPDWFDEAVAILSEGATALKRRNKYLKENIQSCIPLKKLFTMIHPSATKSSESFDTIIFQNIDSNDSIHDFHHDTIVSTTVSTTVSITTTYSQAGDETDNNSLFYPGICSFINFLIEKEGNDIVKKIAEGYINRMSMTEILQQHAKNIPSDITELEREWVKWVEE